VNYFYKIFPQFLAQTVGKLYQYVGFEPTDGISKIYIQISFQDLIS